MSLQVGPDSLITPNTPNMSASDKAAATDVAAALSLSLEKVRQENTKQADHIKVDDGVVLDNMMKNYVEWYNFILLSIIARECKYRLERQPITGSKMKKNNAVDLKLLLIKNFNQDLYQIVAQKTPYKTFEIIEDAQPDIDVQYQQILDQISKMQSTDIEKYIK